MNPSAKIILDSISPSGRRVTTAELLIHRFVLAELNTHRAFSRNSASSRAIPLAKQLAKVRADPAMPVVWPAEQKGMQGGDALNTIATERCRELWIAASTIACDVAQRMGEAGVHKSVANRLLEPFLMHAVIVTADDAGWQNFFDLRCSPLAQPEIRVAAELMLQAYGESTPTPVGIGEWHMPYVTNYDGEVLLAQPQGFDLARMASAARCARVSYETHDGVRDLDKDVQLFERLANPGDGSMHASPFEHVCTPDDSNPPGNLGGWRQWRHELEAIHQERKRASLN